MNIKSDWFLLDGTIQLPEKMDNVDFSDKFCELMETQGWSYGGLFKPLTELNSREWSFFRHEFIKKKKPKCSKCDEVAIGSHYDIEWEEICFCAVHYTKEIL